MIGIADTAMGVISCFGFIVSIIFREWADPNVLAFVLDHNRASCAPTIDQKWYDTPKYYLLVLSLECGVSVYLDNRPSAVYLVVYNSLVGR